MKQILFVTLFALAASGCGSTEQATEGVPAALARPPVMEKLEAPAAQKPALKPEPTAMAASEKPKTATAPKEAKQELKVTFVALGSEGCVPCRMMQPIMAEIEEEYAGQVKILFYDVWKPEGRPYAQKYGIRAIPTQVFLDKDGNEYFRHTGYLPKEELVKVLKMQGVE